MGLVQPQTVPRGFPHLFFALLSFIIFAPLAIGPLWQRLIYLGLTLAMLLAVVRLSWFQRWARRLILAFVVLAVIASAIKAFTPHDPFSSFLLLFMAAVFVILTVQLVAKITHDKVVNADTLYGAACIYLLIGITWALVYSILASAQPETLRFADPRPPADVVVGWPNYLYFSFTTLATIGYGDITPATQLVRSVVILEAISGVFYVAVLIGRLVDLYHPKA